MSTATDPLFSCDDLRVEVAGRTLVDALSFEVRPGELLAILGQNGSGKTLTMHTLAGLREAARGQALLGGRDISRGPRQDTARRLALLPQHVDDIFPATVLETAMIGRHPHIGRFEWESPRDTAITRAALAAVDDALDHPVHVVGLARVLRHDAVERGVGAHHVLVQLGVEGRVVGVVAGQEAEQLLADGEGLVLGLGHEMGHARVARVALGAAQFLRDARIAPIYEGTNGIQALDLVTRKVPLRDGQVVKEYLAEMSGLAAELRGIDGFARSADELDRAIESLTEASTHVGAKMASGEYADAVAGATPFTRKLFL